MATIKSYTDLEQSKKLAEFLPLESADGYWDLQQGGYILIACKLGYYINDSEIPCWSLAALFNIIPQEIFNGEYIIDISEGRNNKWVISYLPLCGVSSYLDVSGNTLVDCCVELIVKLKERKLI